MAPKSSLLQKALILGDARITAPLLFAICYYPEKLQRILPSQLSWITSKAFIRTLGLIAIFDTVRKVNLKLSDRLLNNGEPITKFKKSQEIVLITGGASGIGASVAKKLAAMGVKVVIMDLNSPEEVVSGVTFFKVDITSSKEISEAASEIRKSVGEPTVLINNAGIGTVRTILGGSEAGIRQTFEVNTMAHFWLVKEFVPAMIKKNHGHIVTIASMASFVVHARNVDYCCTKASCVAFHEGLASELKHVYDAPNVKTSIFHPSWVRTPLIEPLTSHPDFIEPVLELEDVSEAIVNQVLSGRSAQIFLPSKLSFVSSIRGWPSWLQEGVRNNIGRQLSFVTEP